MLIVRALTIIKDCILRGETVGIGVEPSVNVLGLDWNNAAVMPGRGYLESNWILGVLGRELLLWGASQSRMPAFKRFSQVTVQDVDPHLQ